MRKTVLKEKNIDRKSTYYKKNGVGRLFLLKPSPKYAKVYWERFSQLTNIESLSQMCVKVLI